MKFSTIGEKLKQLVLSDDTLSYYLNAMNMLLLTDKLKLYCYVLFETKEVLTITKIYFTIINILNFRVC